MADARGTHTRQGGAAGMSGMATPRGRSSDSRNPMDSVRDGSLPAARNIDPDVTRGTDRPTPAEQADPGAHDRGGWLTLDEAAQQFGVGREALEQALQEGRMAGRRVAEEKLSPDGAPPEVVVPEGQGPLPPMARDEWLVQPDQVEHFLAAQRT